MGQYIPTIVADADDIYRSAMEYQSLEVVYFDEETNQFFDAEGKVIHNIYEWLLPTDIMMFREDMGNCVFPLRYDPQILVEIVCEDNDIWTQETLEAWERWNYRDADRGCGYGH